MMINNFTIKDEFTEIKSIKRAHNTLQKMIEELNKLDIPQEITSRINILVQDINTFNGNKKEYKKILHKTYSSIEELIKKELNIVISGHYMAIWMALGMGMFGMPIGMAWFAFTQNPAFIGLGIPIGMSIGLAIGALKENKAKNNNKLINVK